MAGVVFSVAGGLAIFLFGLRVLSDALKRTIGDRMRSLLERLTGRPYRGAIVGALTSGILQSSSMTMVLLIGLINAGVLTLSQGIGVMLGSEIGTTLTAQIIAFKIGQYYMPIVALGFVLSEVFRGKRAGDVGRMILGFGLLFLGMTVVTTGLKGLTESPGILHLLQSCGGNVILGVLVGAAVTAVIQSSSAMTALVLALGSTGLITLPAAVALILGANIGTTVTAQIASIGASLSSRRLAVTQLAVNVLGVAVFVPFVPWYSRIIAMTSPSLTRQIANAHTFFNVVVTLALIPCVGGLVWLAERLIRGRERGTSAMPMHLGEEFLATPAIAVRQAQRELVRMGDMTLEMLRSCRIGVLERSPAETASVYEVEEAVDQLDDAVDAFVDRIDGSLLTGKDERRLHVLHHVAADIERVGDQAVNIAVRTDRLLRDGRQLSEAASGELRTMFDRATALYARSLEALRSEGVDVAREALADEKELDKLEALFKAHHVSRVDTERCDPEAGMLFVEILHNLERIGDHAANIAGDVLLIQPSVAGK